jgi:hypothetical protein
MAFKLLLLGGRTKDIKMERSMRSEEERESDSSTFLYLHPPNLAPSLTYTIELLHSSPPQTPSENKQVQVAAMPHT